MDIHGTVAVVDGCLVLQRDEGYTIPIFADLDDARWSNGGLVIAGTSFKPGEQLVHRGGYPVIPDEFDAYTKYLPDACLETGIESAFVFGLITRW